MKSKNRNLTKDSTKNFYKRNYVKATEIITPKFYIEEDLAASGSQLNIIDELINTNINIADKYSSVIISSIGGVSAVSSSNLLSSISSYDGLSKFFIKQNNLTDIDAIDFERRILFKLGKSFSNFDTSSDFKNYLSSTLFPSIRLNTPSASFDGVPPSSLHEYLIVNLSWIYLLNVSGASYHGYNILTEVLADKFWRRQRFLINDAVKCLTEYVFRNFTVNRPSWFPLGILPTDYLPDLVLADTTYTSGLQQLDKLKTLIDVAYSPAYADRTDTKVRDAFEEYQTTQTYQDSLEPQGPFYKYLKGISYAFSDYNNSIESLETLNDILNCPDETLPYIADMLGWSLFGSDPLKWRIQILNAISVYKAAGTKKSLQFVLNSLFTKDSLEVSTSIVELWESYVPHLIYYSIATESRLLKDFDTWTQKKADEFNIHYIPSSLDESVRCVVDEIILRIAKTFDLKFWYNGSQVSVGEDNLFNYRGRDFLVPPFEEYQFYVNQKLSSTIIEFIVDQLICFGVSRTFAEQVGNYILTNSIKSNEDVSLGYSWLIFTSGVQYPPNWNSLILDISNKKTEYLPLWNGKSSHFKLFFDIDEFNFKDTDFVFNTREGMRTLGKLLDDFTPIHAINQLMIRTSATDNFVVKDRVLSLLSVDVKDHPELNNSDNFSFGNTEVSGHSLNFYKRGKSLPYNVVSRTSVDSIVDSLMQTSAIAVPRKSFRRRNFKATMSNFGYYSRTGFNMPTTFENYVKENSYSSLGFLPLGLIPSSQQYVNIPDYDRLPPIYTQCEGLYSSSIYSGLAVSNTFPCRGLQNQWQVEPVPDNPIDVYLWFGDSLAAGVDPSMSAMNTYYTQIKDNVSGTYLFIPSAGNFQLIQPAKNSNILQVTSTTSSIGPDWTFGYELYKKNQRNSYIIKFGLPNSFGVSADNTFPNTTSQQSPILGNNPSINDWSIYSTNECLNIYKNWITSAINSLTNTYGDRVTYRGSVSFLGTNAVTGLLTTDELIDFSLNGNVAVAFTKRYINSINEIKQNIESFIKTTGIYKGSPIWISCYPDQKYTTNINALSSSYFSPFRANFGSLVASNTNVYLYDPPSYLNLFDNIHYNGSSNLFLGSSIANFFYESKLDANRLGYNALDYSVDRNQLDNIMRVLFYIGENSKRTLASAIVQKDLSSYTNYLPWKNVVDSIANTLTEQDTGFPTNYSDYKNFKFGKDIHKLYNVYCRTFQRHPLIKNNLYVNGPNIFGHTFGSILANSDFTKFGNVVQSHPNLIVTSISSISSIYAGEPFFPSAGGSNESRLLYTSSFKFGSTEVANSGILQAIDLIHTIGSNTENSFTIYNLGKQPYKNYTNRDFTYVINNNIIQITSKARSGLPRLRFDVKSYYHNPTEGHPLSSNLLIPEHQFKLEFLCLFASDDFKKFGSGSVGILIHTANENGWTWVYGTDNKWTYIPVSSLTFDTVKQIYSHRIDLAPKEYTLTSQFDGCIEYSNLYNLNPSDFTLCEVTFNTINRNLLVPKDYFNANNHVHRENQNYIIDIFPYPNQDRSFYLDKINLIDLTLNKWSKVLVSSTNFFPVGDMYCEEYRLDLTREHIYYIFKHFKEITGTMSKFGKASRVASVTQDILEVSGGSRLNYRLDPNWLINTKWNNLNAVGLVSSIYLSN